MNAIGCITRLLGTVLSVLALAAPALASLTGSVPQEVPDIFIGTLEKDGSAIVLRRCDLAENRYVLVDAPGSHMVDAVRKMRLPAYGEVLGSYAEQHGRAILRVENIGNLTTGKSCHVLDALDAMDKTLGGTAADPQAPAPVKAQPEPAFAGHYYLSGVRETGSELLLNKDGTFQWFLAYGAVDQAAQGKWHRQGDTVVLTTTLPATDKPLFGYLKTDPWSAEAEELLRRRDRDRQAEAVRGFCPFQTTAWVSTPPPASVGEEPQKPSADGLREKAADTSIKALALRTQVEVLARQMMAKSAPPPSDEKTQQVNALLSDWLQAKDQAENAAQAAGLPDPALGEPALPAACNLPVEEPVPDDPSQWRGGLAARVFDADSEQVARNVRITLRFADGHAEDVLTASRGFAILPTKPSTAVVGATLQAVHAKNRDASFTFAPVRVGILQFSIDMQQLVEPPFATLRLKIADQALIPEELGRGRYERKP